MLRSFSLAVNYINNLTSYLLVLAGAITILLTDQNLNTLFFIIETEEIQFYCDTYFDFLAILKYIF